MRRRPALRLLAVATVLCAPVFARAADAPAPVPPARDAEYYRNWGLGMINAFPAYLKGLTGKGVVVSVVDTGLYVRHPEFTGRVSRDRVNLGNDQSENNVNPPFESDGSVNFTNGHGTHVAGIIAAARNGVGMQGVAYEATLLPVRAIGVENSEIQGDLGNIALLYSAANGASIINGSYGWITLSRYVTDARGNSVSNPNYTELDYMPLFLTVDELKDTHRILKSVADQDVVMVFAAGNNYDEQPVSSALPSSNGVLSLVTPETLTDGTFRLVTGDETFDIDNEATYKFITPTASQLRTLDLSDLQHTMIVVVALDKNGTISSYSNRCGATAAWCIAAPGGDSLSGADEGIYSTWPFSTRKPDPYAYDNGTSMAAPHVSGAAALVRQAFPYMTASQTIETLLTTATDLGTPEIYGQGLLNVGAAVNGPMEFRYAGIFDVDTDGYLSVWSNPISGVGDLTKRGDGALVLSGDNTYSGPTLVRGGTLAIDGRIVSDTTVSRGGVLAGTGTVGDVTLTRGAAIAPGSVLQTGPATATLRVAGSLVQGAGSIYAAGLAGTTSDRIAATGTAVIGADTTLALARAAGTTPTVGGHYTLLSARNGVSGTYGTVSADFMVDRPFVALGVSYDATTVAADFSRTGVAFADLAGTANARAAAAAADTLGPQSALYNRLAFLDTGAAGSAFTRITGEIHPDAQSVLMGDSHFVRDAATGRLRAALAGIGPTGTGTATVTTPGTEGLTPAPAATERLAVWGQGYGAWGTLDSTGNSARVDASAGGFLVGADAPVGDAWRLGALAGYSRTSFKADAVSSSGSAKSYQAGLYAGARWDRIGLRSGLAYGWNSLDTDRAVAIDGTGETLSARYDAGTFQMFGDLGYRIDTRVAAFEPFGNLAYVSVNTDGFQETGGAAALSGADASMNTGFSTLGLRAATTFSLGPVSATARAELGWRHAYGDVTPEAALAFGNGVSFPVQGAPIAGDAAAIAAGLDLGLTPSAVLAIAYQGQFADGARESGVNGRLSFRF